MKRISKDIFRSRNLPEPSTRVSFRVRLYFRVSRTLIVILAEKSQNDETCLRFKEKPAAQGSVRCNRVTEFVGKTLGDLGRLRRAWPLGERTRFDPNVDEGSVCLCQSSNPRAPMRRPACSRHSVIMGWMGGRKAGRRREIS